MTQDKNTGPDELWNAIHDEIKTYSSGSVREVSEITDAATAVARSRIELAEKERDLMLRELQRVRVRLADELRRAASDVMVKNDPVRDAMALSLPLMGSDPQLLAAEAYRAVADVLERGGER